MFAQRHNMIVEAQTRFFINPKLLKNYMSNILPELRVQLQTY